MNAPATAPMPVFLDCDTGVDDSLALAYLLSSPAVRLVGIGTVSGNTSSEQAARNSLDLLALLGAPEVPVAIGARDHLRKTYNGGVPHIHGVNGVGDVDLPTSPHEPVAASAARLLIDLSHEHAGDLHIVAIGPLTNLALALREDPTLPSRVIAVTIMGGAALAPGNLSPVAEANIGNDPEAAAAVVEADWDLTIVPLDVTMENVLHEADRLRLLESDVPGARALGEILDLYFDFYLPTYGTRSSALHDPLAAAIAAGGVIPTLAPRVPVVVDTTDGPGRGQTVADLRGQRLGAVDHPGVRTRMVLGTDRPLGPHLLDVVTAPARRNAPVEV